MRLCVDIGNSRVKVAVFAGASAKMSTPHGTLSLADDADARSQFDVWLDALAFDRGSLPCWIASVQSTTCKEFVEHLQKRDDIARTHVLTWQDFPMKLCVDHPEQVGVDRLAAALAARHLVDDIRSVIVVDLGTAITIDRVSATGEFEGGAILPGIDLAAQALHTSTDALPHIELSREFAPSPLPCKSTEAAITAGLYWGAIGGIREIVGRLSEIEGPEPALFITGGAAAAVAPRLGFKMRHEADLVLRGVALAAKG